MHPTLPLDILLPPVLMLDTSNVESLEAFKELSLILPTPVNNSSHDRNDTLSLNTFWLRTTPSTFRILTDALHELHASNRLPDPDEDVAAMALQAALHRQGNTRTVVDQPADWYGVGAILGSEGDGTAAQRAIFARPGMGNSFEHTRQERALLDIAGRTGGGEQARRQMEREVSSFWTRELDARVQRE
jgi:hypothetical protein